MKPRDVTTSIIKVGDEVKVMCVFSLSVKLLDDNARRTKEKQIKNIIEGVEIDG